MAAKVRRSGGKNGKESRSGAISKWLAVKEIGLAGVHRGRRRKLQKQKPVF